MSCLAGTTFQIVLDRISPQRRILVVVILGVVGIYLVYHISLLVRLHPYEYIYYNSLAGGVRGASQHYETDYWGMAGSEAAQWLSQYLTENQSKRSGAIKVYYCNNKKSINYYLPEYVRFITDPNKADYFIGGIRDFCIDEIPGEEIFSVSRMGVDLAVIKIPHQIK
jgi:hypothetical protein